MDSLSVANIKYLVAIYSLQDDYSGVKCSDIAIYLGVSRPSVNAMAHKLNNKGLVENSRYSKLYLTIQGLELAEKYAVCFRLMKSRFNGFLPDKINSDDALYAFISEIPLKDLYEVCKETDII